MPNRYTIKRLPADAGAMPLSGAFFPAEIPSPYAALDEAYIGCYPWSDGAYEPPACARVGWNEKGLHVLLYAKEETIRADETRTGGRVCLDSCLEFFFRPFPDADERYLNIEANPIATVHIGLGEGRPHRRVWDALPGDMNITHSDHADGWWAVSYTVPANFLAEIFAGRALASGHSMLGNFYKCDESQHPHFGCWNPICSERPDFHRPECFGTLVLE